MLVESEEIWLLVFELMLVTAVLSSVWRVVGRLTKPLMLLVRLALMLFNRLYSQLPTGVTVNSAYALGA